MQSVRYCFKQILAVVLTESLVLSMAPPPSQAAAEAAHVALAPWHLTRSSHPKREKPLEVNSDSLAISPESENSIGPRGVGTGDSEKERVVPVVAANPAKPSTTDIEAKSIVKPLHLGGATTPGARPLAFIENKGQFNDRVKFQVPGNGHTLWLTDSGIVFDFARAKSTQTTRQLLEARPAKVDPKTVSVGESSRLEKSAIREGERHVIYQDFVGTNRGFTIETKGAQPGAYNYIAGSDQSKWQTQVRGFSEVVYHDIWKGVDLRLYGRGPDLEQEFVVRPGANLGQVHVAYQGIDRLEVTKDGSLVIRTTGGEMRESVPKLYQEIAGRRVLVEGQFKLLTATSYTFEASGYKTEYALVVDPTLLYSTFLGGSSLDATTGIAVDAAGNAYVTGYTSATDFPTTPSAYQPAYRNDGTGSNMFVTKLNPTGSGLVYSTYLSGASYTRGIAVDAAGNAYVAGSNANNVFGFPTTSNAYSQSCSGSGFLTVLNPSGNGLIYSTCFGSGGSLNVTSMTADTNGRVYITGYTGPSGIPTTPNAYQPSYPGPRQPAAFITIFDTRASGSSSLTYSTYFGTPSTNTSAYGTQGEGIAVDSFGNAYITGFTGDGLPVTPGAFQSSRTARAPCNPSGGTVFTCPNAFVAKLNPSASGASSLIYSTYLGGSFNDQGGAITVDGFGNAYVTGFTQSADFPVTPGAFQTSADTTFISKLNPTGSSLIYSTYLGTGGGGTNSIAIDQAGNAFITGIAGRPLAGRSFPVTPGAFQSSFSGLNTDAFLTEINSNGSNLIYSTYFGGHGDESGIGVALDQTGDVYITGPTQSRDLPTRNAFQPSMNGAADAFVSKFSVGAGGALSILAVFPSQGGNNGTITPTIIGSGFHYGATATLSCPRSSSIPGTNATVSPDGRTISASFSLVGQAPGLCSVTIANLDGTNVSQQAALTVLQGGSEDVQLDFFGRSGIRGSTASTFSAGYSNRGTVDSRAFRVWISFNNFFTWSPPPGMTPSSAGQLNGTTYVGFDVPSVPAGSSGWIPIQLIAPSNLGFHFPFQVQVWEEVQ